jgi:uncharacterized protein
MIIGRNNEKDIFDKLLASNKAEFVTVYGRRRVGKTYLIRQYFGKKIVFDFTGSNNAKLQTHLNNFYEQLQRVYPIISQKNSPKSWAEAFQQLADFGYQKETENQKFVIFIDELPWLDTPKSGFLSALEYFWNQHGSRMNHLCFITCGSAASWIIKNLLFAKGGLYNRITKRIELKPFTLVETAEFCKAKYLKFTSYQIAQLYMVLGGIPFYWEEVEQGKSVAQTIDKLCFSANGILANEFKPLYQSLFQNADISIEIVRQLAEQPYGLTRNELLKKLQISNGGSFVRTIESLIDCGFVVSLQPFDKRNRESLLRVIDFYSIFYLKFIENAGKSQNQWENLSNNSSYITWQGYAYENICLIHQQAIQKALGISGVFTKVSSFYFKGNDTLPGSQIDLVLERNDGIIQLCEVKFTNKEFIVDKNYIAKLRQRRLIFETVTKTKKAVVSTLFTTYPAIRNEYYLEEIHSEVCLEEMLK